MLNPLISLANHVLVASPTFSRTFSRCEYNRNCRNSKSHENICKQIYKMKNVQRNYFKVKENGFKTRVVGNKKNDVCFQRKKPSSKQHDTFQASYSSLLSQLLSRYSLPICYYNGK